MSPARTPQLTEGTQVVLREPVDAGPAGSGLNAAPQGATGKVRAEVKRVRHLLRLLLSGQVLLATGRVVMHVGANRERLLAVRNGNLSWDDVEQWRLGLHARWEDALESSPLPEGPDVHRVDQWLQSVRRRGVEAAVQAGVEGRQVTGNRECDPPTTLRETPPIHRSGRPSAMVGPAVVVPRTSLTARTSVQAPCSFRSGRRTPRPARPRQSGPINTLLEE